MVSALFLQSALKKRDKMIGRHYVHNAKITLRLMKFRFENRKNDSFTCPVCIYTGPFESVNPPTGLRKHAKCPKCGAPPSEFEKIEETPTRMSIEEPEMPEDEPPNHKL